MRSDVFRDRIRCVRRASVLALLLCLFITPVGWAAEQRPRVTLQLWTIWGGTRIPLMDRIVNEFEVAHPGIHVEHVIVDGGQRYDKFVTAVASGAPPDVMMIGRHEVPALAESQLIMPLDTYMAQDRDVRPDMFFPSEFQTCLWQGKTYVLPMPTGAGANGVVYYNKNLLAEAGLDSEKLPETWREFTTLGRRLSRFSGEGKLEMLGVDVRGGGDRWFISWLHSNNGEYARPDARRYSFYSPQGIEAVEWVRSMVDLLRFRSTLVVREALFRRENEPCRSVACGSFSSLSRRVAISTSASVSSLTMKVPRHGWHKSVAGVTGSPQV
jgi:ABC-type glycerol-3-phosphate transport system substrate-binding protein